MVPKMTAGFPFSANNLPMIPMAKYDPQVKGITSCSPMKRSEMIIIPSGRRYEYLVFSLTLANKAIAVNGTKLGGCGRKRAMTPNKTSKLIMIKLVRVDFEGMRLIYELNNFII